MNLIFHVYFVYQYSTQVETGVFDNRTSDYFVFITFCGLACDVKSKIKAFFYVFSLASWMDVYFIRIARRIDDVHYLFMVTSQFGKHCFIHVWLSV